ncbi:GrpE-domain-containing protein [Coniella lustricola]|uniref:GrpE protein homolog n=1 Tax=Coniella lustricola TaxID=2025994 RepID=A0A2T3ABR9_9PEZI|nr:GrpE-domain-containing protein [Coniella lustricola]
MLRQALFAPLQGLRSAGRSIPQRSIAHVRTFITPIPARNTRSAAAARCYSGATNNNTTESQDRSSDAEAKPAGESTQTSTEGAEDSVVAELKKKLETKEKEALDWKDKCLRSIADFRNLQDRTQREVKNAREFAIQGFAKDLVDSVDNLDRALSMVPAAKLASEEKSDDLQELVNLYEGIKMTDGILINTLKKHGLERFDPTNEKFNPNEHEATFMSPQEGKDENTVFYVQQKGFKLNGRVLRAAKVGVVKNK